MRGLVSCILAGFLGHMRWFEDMFWQVWPMQGRGVGLSMDIVGICGTCFLPVYPCPPGPSKVDV